MTKKKRIGLIMRKGYGIHADHIDTLRRFVDEIYLWTAVESEMIDPRFAHVYNLPPLSEEDVFERIIGQAKQFDIPCFITWQETDVLLTAKLNEQMGNFDVPVSAAMISRNKIKQRKFLVENNLPCPRFNEVASLEEALTVAQQMGYPVIIKPTKAASSANVSLVFSDEELKKAYQKLDYFVTHEQGFYEHNRDESYILIEEFVSGEEVTVDGVVVNGQFYLGGIHHKKRMMGPFFEEDEYTLPYIGEQEAELKQLAEAICSSLGLKNSLFNVEVRQDHHGQPKIIEFSARISGGHVYRNIRDVHKIDLVAAHLTGVLGESQEVSNFFLDRSPFPRVATCIKFVYASGTVRSNHAGDAALEPAFRAYYPVARPGESIKRAPEGFDIAGLLSVWGEYKAPEDLEKIRQSARLLEKKLGLNLDTSVFSRRDT